MADQGAQAPASSSRQVRETRLGLLKAAEGLTGTEALRLVLHQAVADLGGLGGMVHLVRAPDRRLRLDVANGLPRPLAAAWEDLGWDEDVAPALAVRSGAFVWVPPTTDTADPDMADPDRADPDAATTHTAATDTATTGTAAPVTAPGPAVPPDGPEERPAGSEERPGSDERPRTVPEGTGLAAVPLVGPDGPLGALSVLLATSGEPDPEKRAFLEVLAGRAAARLRRSPPTRGTLAPAWWQEPSDSRVEQAMREVKVGVWDWDVRTGELRCDEAMLAAFGWDRDTFDGRIETWSELIHPDDLPGVLAELNKVIPELGVASVEYRLRHPDGRISWIEARGQVTAGEDGEPARMTGTAWDTTRTRMERDSVGRALKHMSDGFFAVDADWRITYANVQAERFFGTAGQLVGTVLWDAVPEIGALALEEQARQAVAAGTPIGFDIQLPDTRRWYHMRIVPVPGGLTVYFTDVTEQRRHDAERVRAESAAAERAARIGVLTRALAQALTVRDVVRAVADHVLPPFGAAGLVVQSIEGERLHVVGSVGYSGTFLDRIAGQRLADVSPVADALGSRSPRFISSPEEFIERYPENAGYPAAAAKGAWAFLPLIASGEIIGCCVISFDRPRHLTGEERTLFTALSGLIAQAFARARLYDAEHTRAQELQRGMLPRALPNLLAVTVAARFLPVSDGGEVGGDWYDVIPLSAARVALVIGDVMGHGLAEAATMGRLRTAVHTLADLELPPGELLAHLNDLVSDLGDDFYATCLYAVYDPTTRVCVLASAGHPPPAIVEPDGTVRFPELAGDPPLGAATPPFDTVETTMAEGSLLVLYTDGLVESRTRDINLGMARLARALTSAPARTTQAEIDRLCDVVTADLLPARQRTLDDAALLIVRMHGLGPGDIASWPLPEHPVAAGEARHHVRDQLARWHLEELTMTTELLASELVGNAVRHAKGPMRLRLLRGQTLVCEVSDGSPTTPRIRRAADTDEGGRGLQLVAAVSHRWGARHTAEGKCIWTEQLLSGPSLDQHL
ncbi:SpoIIE family protein phosphatase [Streptomyces sp. NPDC055078]